MKQTFFVALISLIISLCVPVPSSAQNARQQLLTRINGLRSELGLPPYSLNGALNAAALNHAQWMVNTSQVTHIQEDGSSPSTRAQANGYNSQWVSENIYMGGLASVNTAWTFWVNSSIHYAGLTSDNFQDIGIATAQGDGGRAYVLVFGVPPSAVAVSSSGGNSAVASGNVAAAPPAAIIGYDAVGNIQYQLQAGDTLGQVLLLFGYTWDDLNSLLDLNDLTEADITNLAVGQTILVPPPQGTYTPTPIAEVTEEVMMSAATESVPTEPVDASASTASATSTANSGIIPTPVPQSDTEVSVLISLSPTMVEERVGQPATFVAIAASPTMTETVTAIPTLQVNNAQPTQIAQVTSPTPAVISEASPQSVNRQAPPLWLIGAIVLQLGIFGYAVFEGIRRWRKSG